jgi:hypothetical protein
MKIHEICDLLDFTQRRMLDCYRRFGTYYRSHLQRSSRQRTAWPLKIWSISSETSVGNYHSTLRKTQKSADLIYTARKSEITNEGPYFFFGLWCRVGFELGTNISESFTRGVKWPGSGFDHPPSSSAEVKEKVELYLHYPCGTSWSVLGWTVPFYQHFGEICCLHLQGWKWRQ